MTLSLQQKYHYICIPTRTLLFLLIFLTPDTYMKYWLIAAIIAFMIVSYRYLTFTNNQLGTFGQPVKWQQMRLFHLTTLSFFILCTFYKNYTLAKMLPLLDILSIFFYTPTN